MNFLIVSAQSSIYFLIFVIFENSLNTIRIRRLFAARKMCKLFVFAATNAVRCCIYCYSGGGAAQDGGGADSRGECILYCQPTL